MILSLGEKGNWRLGHRRVEPCAALSTLGMVGAEPEEEPPAALVGGGDGCVEARHVKLSDPVLTSRGQST